MSWEVGILKSNFKVLANKDAIYFLRDLHLYLLVKSVKQYFLLPTFGLNYFLFYNHSLFYSSYLL